MKTLTLFTALFMGLSPILTWSAEPATGTEQSLNIICKDLTITFDDGNTTVNVSAWQLVEVSAGTEPFYFSVDGQTALIFNCFNANTGPQSYVVSVTDGMGEVAMCMSTIEVIDAEPPLLYCPAQVDLYLDANGEAVLTYDQAVIATSDNCSVSVSLEQELYTCFDTGFQYTTVTAADPSGNTTDFTLGVMVHDTISQPASSGIGYIDCVTIDGHNNCSGDDGGYGDYTAESINLKLGAWYDMILTPGGFRTNPDLWWVVWVDWNRDGAFTDDEIIHQEERAGTVHTGFVLRYEVGTGLMGVRVAMAEGQLPYSCSPGGYSEVEDYQLMVLPDLPFLRETAPGIDKPSSGGFKIFPIPANEILHIKPVPCENCPFTLEIFNVQGQLQAQLPAANQDLTIDVSHWPRGVYILKWQDPDGFVGSRRIMVQ